MSLAKILIVEDDMHLGLILNKFLTHHGYECTLASSGKEAITNMEENLYHIAIIDVMLPDSDGWSILRHLKAFGDTPAIMLTARREEEDKLLGFELGADDYVTKPFSNKLLLARIKAVLKRSNKSLDESILISGDLTLSKLSHQVLIKDEEISITPIEYSLLEFFMHNINIVLSREAILTSVWGYDYYGDERTVDTHIKRLRSKIKGSTAKIATVRGVGYRMVDHEK